MYKVNDYIVYKKDVCRIKEIKEKYYKGLDYYVLMPINDESLTIQTPINHNLIRPLITKEEIEVIIKEIPNIAVIEIQDRNLENEYKRLLSGNHLDLVKIIKTTYLRNQKRIDNHKKMGDKDNYYFEKAEKYLYTEIGTVLGLSYEETKEYIINRLK